MSRYHAERIAARVLADSGATPPIDAAAVAKGLGITVVREDLPENVSGVLLAEKDPPIIAVSRADHSRRQRFSVAHELGHYLLHRSASSLFVDANPTFFRDERSSQGADWQEIEANAFAAALLMPVEALRQYLREHPVDPLDDTPLGQLAKAFGVSTQAMAIRLAILNLV